MIHGSYIIRKNLNAYNTYSMNLRLVEILHSCQLITNSHMDSGGFSGISITETRPTLTYNSSETMILLSRSFEYSKFEVEEKIFLDYIHKSSIFHIFI